MSIYLTALLKGKPGTSAQLIPLLEQLVENSKTEKACLQYELYQDNENPDLFIFHETWENQAGLELHIQQEHYVNFGKLAAELLSGPVALYRTNKVK